MLLTDGRDGAVSMCAHHKSAASQEAFERASVPAGAIFSLPPTCHPRTPPPNGSSCHFGAFHSDELH